ncbi:MAG: response regulator [Bacteriovoracaceae bacterium]
MKILIIEDEILIQQSLKKLLIRRGCEAWTASSGQEALTLIEAQEFDRIVCDLMLQDITGFDIIEESKKKYDENKIKECFIIMTAYSSEQVLSKAREYGCVILNKPFDLEQALKIITAKG